MGSDKGSRIKYPNVEISLTCALEISADAKKNNLERNEKFNFLIKIDKHQYTRAICLNKKTAL